MQSQGLHMYRIYFSKKAELDVLRRQLITSFLENSFYKSNPTQEEISFFEECKEKIAVSLYINCTMDSREEIARGHIYELPFEDNNANMEFYRKMGIRVKYWGDSYAEYIIDDESIVKLLKR